MTTASFSISAVSEAGDDDPRIGADLGGYRVQAFVADGAMGRVYEAGRIADGCHAAIKVLHPKVATDPIAVERFKREFETAEELAHPHIVKVFDFGTTEDGSWFLAMEFLKGEELGERIRREGAQPFARIVRILSQMAEALDHAHSFGVIHRDLKPDNVFLVTTEEGDEIRILDFGTVKLQMDVGPKLTAFGTTIGSPYYMSPEQAMGAQDVDQRTDVFAVGAILYELLTGKVAFDGKNVAQVLMRIVNEPTPVPSFLVPELPTELDAVVEAGCAKSKETRYGSVGELADAFCAAIGLSGGAKQWAHASQEDIESALGVTDSAAGSSPAPAPHQPGDPVAAPVLGGLGGEAGPAAPMAPGPAGPREPVLSPVPVEPVPARIPTATGPLLLAGVGVVIALLLVIVVVLLSFAVL